MTRYPRYTMRHILTDVRDGRHPTHRTPLAIRGVVRALEAGWIGTDMTKDGYVLTPSGSAHLAALEDA